MAGHGRTPPRRLGGQIHVTDRAEDGAGSAPPRGSARIRGRPPSPPGPDDMAVSALRAARGSARGSLRRHDAIAGYLFALPTALGFLLFGLGPVLGGLALGFMRYDLLPPALGGLREFRQVGRGRPRTADFRQHRVLRGRHDSAGSGVGHGAGHRELLAGVRRPAQSALAHLVARGQEQRDHHDGLERGRLQHAVAAGRLAGHSRRTVRSGHHRRGRTLGQLPPDYGAPAVAGHFLHPGQRRDRGLPVVRPAFRPDPERGGRATPAARC